MKRKWYEWMLTIVYIAMVVLCVFLNFTPGHEESLTTKIVNIVMFIIVAIIFIMADLGCFAPMNNIIRDLKAASFKIKEDAMSSRTFLWEPYSQGNVELFRTKHLKDLFRDFVFELNRESDAENVYYKPGIDDYINGEMVDSVMHRNEMNQVAGMLTGLGILGTFIGLSLGLQNFNTGTTAQMTESIEPLMNGIKVAFHTSIYGMVFSLTFNAVYKRKLYEADQAVEAFVKSFKKFVLPDTTNNGMNQLLQLQGEQLNALFEVSDRIGESLSETLESYLDGLHDTITEFERVASENQAEAMGRVVEYFIGAMNNSLNGSFENMGNTINAQLDIQKQNAMYMQQVLDAIRISMGNVSDINRESEKLSATLSEYTDNIQMINNTLSRNLDEMRHKDDGVRDIIMREKQMIDEQERLIEGLKEAIGELAKYSKKSNDDMKDALGNVSDSLEVMQKALKKSRFMKQQ